MSGLKEIYKTITSYPPYKRIFVIEIQNKGYDTKYRYTWIWIEWINISDHKKIYEYFVQISFSNSQIDFPSDCVSQAIRSNSIILFFLILYYWSIITTSCISYFRSDIKYTSRDPWPASLTWAFLSYDNWNSSWTDSISNGNDNL